MPEKGRALAGALVMLLAGVGMLGGGILGIVVQKTGAPALAHITECHELVSRYHTVACNGTWKAPGARGRTAAGIVDGATESDVGHTLPVHLSGDRAYVSSLRIPVILLVFGVAFLGYGGHLIRRLRGVT